MEKVLQMCQMIIDHLLNDLKQRDMSKNNDNSHNNLIQENLKLRKLLTLQQKAIAYRRVNLLSSVSYDGNSVDASVTSNVNSELPEDSSRYSLQATKLQCLFCPKQFNDSISFAKHLSLRHSSTNIDDANSVDVQPGSTSIIQRLQQQQLVSSFNENRVQLEKLQNEIEYLKEKLFKTEKELINEKSARKQFESGIEMNIIDQLKQTQNQLNKRIDEINLLKNEVQIAADMATSANRSYLELVKNLNIENNVSIQKTSDSESKIEEGLKPKRKLQTKKVNQQHDVTPLEGQKDQKLDKSKTINKKTEPETIEASTQSNVVSTIVETSKKSEEGNGSQTDLKQTLRMQLITQITTKQDKIKQNKDDLGKSKRKKKAKANHVEVKSVENLQPKNLEQIPKSTNESGLEQTRADIFQSIEQRLKTYLKQNVQQTDSNNGDLISNAMDHFQRDRTLLIQQSRHDYDFVQIENSIRDLIDTKVKSKINDSPSAPDLNLMETLVNQDQDDGSKLEIFKNEEDESPLRSILKTNSNDKEHNKSRRISFNDQVEEYEISPRESDNSDVDSEEINENEDINYIENDNSIFSIKSFGGGVGDDEDTVNDGRRSIPSDYDGEKVYLNNFHSASSTSSSSDEDDNINSKVSLDKNSNKVINVDVHYSDTEVTVPVPAKRKSTPVGTSNSTLNSLLYDEIDDKSQLSSQNRVQELAEMIEKKLQNKTLRPISSKSNGDNIRKPIGSIDTLPAVRDGLFRKSKQSTTETDDYDIYDF